MTREPPPVCAPRRTGLPEHVRVILRRDGLWVLDGPQPLTGGQMPRDAKPKPNETDEDFCKRRFDGREFKCNGCGKPISWPGVCDRCSRRWPIGGKR